MSPNVDRRNSYQHCPAEIEALNVGDGLDSDDGASDVGLGGRGDIDDSDGRSYVGQSDKSISPGGNQRSELKPPLTLLLVSAASMTIGWIASGAFSARHHGASKEQFQDGDDVDVIDASNGVPSLIWSDEFDGDALDLTKWTFVNGNGCDVGLCGWGEFEAKADLESKDNETHHSCTFVHSLEQATTNWSGTHPLMLTSRMAS